MKTIIALLVITGCACAYGQATPAQSYTMRASINSNTDGTITVTAKSPRPLWQTIARIRKKYGWTVDYEESLYPSQLIASDSTHGKYPRGGTFVSHIREPINDSTSEEQRVLQNIVNQYNNQSSMKYRVLKVSGYRFDIAPATRSVLDQPIRIDDQERSLRAEVDAIMAALTNAIHIPCIQGGLMDNSMEQINISLKHSTPVPARRLLNEVLDHAPIQKTWVFTYEPTNGTFAIGIQTAEKWTTNQNGTISVKPLINADFSSSPKE